MSLGVLRLRVLSLGVLSLGVLRLRVLSLGVLSLRVLSLGVLSLGVLSLGVLSLGVLRLVTLPLYSSCVSGTLRVTASGVGLLELGVLPELELVVLRVLGRSRRLPPHSDCVSGTLGAAASGAALLAQECRQLEALVLLEVLEPLVLEVLVQAVLELLGLGVLLELVLLEVLLVQELELRMLELLELPVELRTPRLLELPLLELLVVLLELELLLGVLVRSLQMTLRLSTAPQRVPLPSPPASSLPALADPESESLRAASPTVTRLLATAVTDPYFESAAVSALVADLVAFAARCRLDYAASLVAEPESVSPPSVGDLDAPDILTPCSYAEVIAGEYSSQWQSAMDVEMASWKSTGTYVDEVPPPGANIVSGMWIFRVKRLPGSPPVFKARYVAQGFSQREGVDFFQTFSPTPKMTTLRVLLHVAAQCDYELHSLDFSTAFLQGSLHEEIWLRRPPGFTGSFPPGTQWSLQRPVLRSPPSAT
ncbi:unnamed protein product [Closterium sp. NIES-64]|nr:unnamed protein product [Closterium sp. NIES-64]